VDKEPGAFRTISEVAEDLDLPQHVLRFWETRFSQIKPLKRGGGRRYYRPDDVELLRGIRHLLYGEGYTIRGVQRILKDEGPRFVQTVWRGAEADPAAYEDDTPSAARPAAAAEVEPPRQRPEPPPARPAPPPQPPALPAAPSSSSPPPRSGPEPVPASRPGLLGLLPKLGREPETPALPRVVEVPIPVRKEPPLFPDGEGTGRPPFARPEEGGDAPERPPFAKAPPVEPPPEPRAAEPRVVEPRVVETPAVAPARAEPVLRSAPPEAPRRRSRDDIRRLQAVLRELQDCRRILDAALGGGREP
jgi:DNA-binding transcriptional MerR regulator